MRAYNGAKSPKDKTSQKSQLPSSRKNSGSPSDFCRKSSAISSAASAAGVSRKLGSRKQSELLVSPPNFLKIPKANGLRVSGVQAVLKQEEKFFASAKNYEGSGLKGFEAYSLGFKQTGTHNTPNDNSMKIKKEGSPVVPKSTSNENMIDDIRLSPNQKQINGNRSPKPGLFKAMENCGEVVRSGESSSPTNKANNEKLNGAKGRGVSPRSSKKNIGEELKRQKERNQEQNTPKDYLSPGSQSRKEYGHSSTGYLTGFQKSNHGKGEGISSKRKEARSSSQSNDFSAQTIQGEKETATRKGSDCSKGLEGQVGKGNNALEKISGELSQKENVTTQNPMKPNGNGHMMMRNSAGVQKEGKSLPNSKVVAIPKKEPSNSLNNIWGHHQFLQKDIGLQDKGLSDSTKQKNTIFTSISSFAPSLANTIGFWEQKNKVSTRS